MVFNECHLNSNNLNWKYWQSKCHIKFIEQQWIDSIKALNAAKYSVTTWNFFLSLEFFLDKHCLCCARAFVLKIEYIL